jgi:ribonuclease HI
MADPTTVYTDGACSGNPGPGGWAWAVPGGAWASGFEARTTNQRMELNAVLEAVRSIEGTLDVVTDSTYVANCFRDRWFLGWRKRGWKNEAGRFGVPRWVKGHSGDVMNDLVDRLAVESCQTQAAASGSEPP